MAAKRRDNSWKTEGKRYWWVWTSIVVAVGALLLFSIPPLMGPGGGMGEPIREQQQTQTTEDSIIADNNTSASDNETSALLN